eukprot:CAMPEP_0197908598 /NCGR_PEP_ID=MMETSP1439-20131203/67100_1 /TAXON_ID=66791 /ORGANISM="Gonyaulax spinifera, Strain CCMP409" /LENGTH=233 /DNA_ID=CAMNT_0043530101 /DNA_START=80 /DNA_END=781 /DNA_ORIENTATION=+
MRRTRAAGNVALACGLASWVLAGVAFVSSRTPSVQSFRGRVAAAARGDIEPFRPMSAQPEYQQDTSHWTSVAGIAAAFGLAVTLVATPVRAEEAAAPAPAAPAAPEAAAPAAAAPTAAAPAPAAPADAAPAPAPAPAATESAAPAATKSRRKKGSRPKVAKEDKQETTAPKGPSVVVQSTPEGPQKIIISPSDEIDDDEKSLNATNLPVLFALFFGPSFVYLAFYVLGSLDII